MCLVKTVYIHNNDKTGSWSVSEELDLFSLSWPSPIFFFQSGLLLIFRAHKPKQLLENSHKEVMI